MININECIAKAMKSKNQVELRAYKNLKAEIQILQTAKNAKPYDEAADIEYILYNWADEKNFMDYSGEDLPKITIPKKEMGGAIKHLKARFPQADGKMISEIVKKYIV